MSKDTGGAAVAEFGYYSLLTPVFLSGMSACCVDDMYARGSLMVRESVYHFC